MYWFGLRFDQWWRSARATALPRPVISVGNLTVGGTGKTPLLIYLADYLLARSRKTAVLTRGYPGFGNGGSPSSENDETLLLKMRCPGVAVGAGADRRRNAEMLMANDPPDVFLLDDGFQHWPLKRNLDLVCLDATDPWGGGWLLPAGRLREPRRALRRASAIVLNRMELVTDERRRALINDIESVAMGIPTFVSKNEYQLLSCDQQQQSLADKRLVPLTTLQEKNVVALSAIGNPRAFEATLVRFGARVEPARFPDHHAYTAVELRRVIAQAQAANAPVIMTEKDWVKIAVLPVEKNNLYVLRMSLTFSPDQRLRWEALINGALP